MIDKQTEVSADDDPGRGNPIEKALPILFLTLLLISFATYLSSDTSSIDFITGHIVGVSLLSLMGCWAANIAQRKGHPYWIAFAMCVAVPLLVGFIAVSGIEAMTCGGTPALVTAMLVLAFYSLIGSGIVGNPR